jgi:homocysteine S-methyltransferase
MTLASALPQLNGAMMLTDSGIETDVIYGAGRDLPAFAVFPLLLDDEGRDILRRYYASHLAVAAAHGLGYVLETPTWRSNADWGRSLGYSQEELDDVDREAVSFLRELAATLACPPTVVSGLIGPRGDGYVVAEAMTPDEAEAYHGHQVGVFAEAGVDLVTGCTFTYAAEAVGLARAARRHGTEAVVYFTVETDGRLPDGTALHDAIHAVDEATGGQVAYFGVNCAHPDHMAPAFEVGGPWLNRIGAVRANASRLSHAELDARDDLDVGDPTELAAGYAWLRAAVPAVSVFGGCCGTDLTHLEQIAPIVATPLG